MDKHTHTHTPVYKHMCELISGVCAFADLRGNLQTGVFIQWFGQQTGGYYTSCSSPSQSIAAHPHCTHQTRVSTYTHAHTMLLLKLPKLLVEKSISGSEFSSLLPLHFIFLLMSSSSVPIMLLLPKQPRSDVLNY